MAAIDTFASEYAGLRSLDMPAYSAAAVTKSDSVELAFVSRALYVGAVGDVAVVMADGSTATFVAVPAGTLLPIRVKQVLSTGTSAASIVALG